MPQKIPIKIKLPTLIPTINKEIITIVVDPQQKVEFLLQKVLQILQVSKYSSWFGLATVEKEFEYNFITLKSNFEKKIVKFIDPRYLKFVEKNLINKTYKKDDKILLHKKSSHDSTNSTKDPEFLLYFTIQNYCSNIKYLSSDEQHLYAVCIKSKIYSNNLPISINLSVENMIEMSTICMKMHDAQDCHDSYICPNLFKSKENINIKTPDQLKEFITKCFQKQNYATLTLSRLLIKFNKISIENSEFLNFHYFVDEKSQQILGVSLTGLSIFSKNGILKFEFTWDKIAKLIVSSNGKKLDIFREVSQVPDSTFEAPPEQKSVKVEPENERLLDNLPISPIKQTPSSSTLTRQRGLLNEKLDEKFNRSGSRRRYEYTSAFDRNYPNTSTLARDREDNKVTLKQLKHKNTPNKNSRSKSVDRTNIYPGTNFSSLFRSGRILNSEKSKKLYEKNDKLGTSFDSKIRGRHQDQKNEKPSEKSRSQSRDKSKSRAEKSKIVVTFHCNSSKKMLNIFNLISETHEFYDRYKCSIHQANEKLHRHMKFSIKDNGQHGREYNEINVDDALEKFETLKRSKNSETAPKPKPRLSLKDSLENSDNSNSVTPLKTDPKSEELQLKNFEVIQRTTSEESSGIPTDPILNTTSDEILSPIQVKIVERKNFEMEDKIPDIEIVQVKIDVKDDKHVGDEKDEVELDPQQENKFQSEKTNVTSKKSKQLTLTTHSESDTEQSEEKFIETTEVENIKIENITSTLTETKTDRNIVKTNNKIIKYGNEKVVKNEIKSNEKFLKNTNKSVPVNSKIKQQQDQLEFKELQPQIVNCSIENGQTRQKTDKIETKPVTCLKNFTINNSCINSCSVKVKKYSTVTCLDSRRETGKHLDDKKKLLDLEEGISKYQTTQVQLQNNLLQQSKNLLKNHKKSEARTTNLHLPAKEHTQTDNIIGNFQYLQTQFHNSTVTSKSDFDSTSSCSGEYKLNRKLSGEKLIPGLETKNSKHQELKILANLQDIKNNLQEQEKIKLAVISPRQQYLSKSCDTNEDVSSNIFGHLESEENSICGDNQASNNINQQTHNNKSKISTPTGSLKLSKQKSSSSPDLSSSTYSSSHFDFERDLQEQPQNIEQNNLHQAFENKNSKFKILETSYSTTSASSFFSNSESHPASNKHISTLNNFTPELKSNAAPSYKNLEENSACSPTDHDQHTQNPDTMLKFTKIEKKITQVESIDETKFNVVGLKNKPLVELLPEILKNAHNTHHPAKLGSNRANGSSIADLSQIENLEILDGNRVNSLEEVKEEKIHVNFRDHDRNVTPAPEIEISDSRKNSVSSDLDGENYGLMIGYKNSQTSPKFVKTYSNRSKKFNNYEVPCQTFYLSKSSVYKQNPLLNHQKVLNKQASNSLSASRDRSPSPPQFNPILQTNFNMSEKFRNSINKKKPLAERTRYTDEKIKTTTQNKEVSLDFLINSSGNIIENDKLNGNHKITLENNDRVAVVEEQRDPIEKITKEQQQKKLDNKKQENNLTKTSTATSLKNQSITTQLKNLDISEKNNYHDNDNLRQKFSLTAQPDKILNKNCKNPKNLKKYNNSDVIPVSQSTHTRSNNKIQNFQVVLNQEISISNLLDKISTDTNNKSTANSNATAYKNIHETAADINFTAVNLQDKTTSKPQILTNQIQPGNTRTTNMNLVYGHNVYHKNIVLPNTHQTTDSDTGRSTDENNYQISKYQTKKPNYSQAGVNYYPAPVVSKSNSSETNDSLNEPLPPRDCHTYKVYKAGSENNKNLNTSRNSSYNYYEQQVKHHKKQKNTAGSLDNSSEISSFLSTSQTSNSNDSNVSIDVTNDTLAGLTLSPQPAIQTQTGLLNSSSNSNSNSIISSTAHPINHPNSTVSRKRPSPSSSTKSNNITVQPITKTTPKRPIKYDYLEKESAYDKEVKQYIDYTNDIRSKCANVIRSASIRSSSNNSMRSHGSSVKENYYNHPNSDLIHPNNRVSHMVKLFENNEHGLSHSFKRPKILPRPHTYHTLGRNSSYSTQIAADNKSKSDPVERTNSYKKNHNQYQKNITNTQTLPRNLSHGNYFTTGTPLNQVNTIQRSQSNRNYDYSSSQNQPCVNQHKIPAVPNSINLQRSEVNEDNVLFEIIV